MALAVVGAGTLAAQAGLWAMRRFLYKTTDSPPMTSPTGTLAAYRSVTQGGFGTVWTTRVYVREVGGGREALIYENRDSGFEPSLRWRGAETLEIGIPQGRVDHLANPGADQEASAPLDRLVVVFRQLDRGAHDGKGE